MKNIKIPLIILIIGLSALPSVRLGIFAQSMLGKLNYYPQIPVKSFSPSDSLKILAVMVEFMQDDDPNTYGNGKFGSIYSQNYGDTIMDPLPFDASYFSNHLEFAKNYFKKVSKNKLNISYKVLPNIVTVSKIMREYSPPSDTPNQITNLGLFAQEVWQLVSQQNPNFDFSKYDLFIIFHAGVGRDIQLPGSLGYERDLPSIYLGLKSLQSIFGENFDGFVVNSNFKIKNSLILPSTESREVQQLNSTVLFQMTTNGLIVASIASYLGLPDLFNTETGRSAIGRFGLMDGAAIFAYSGAFPPEPSAWEKIFLGWAKPVTVNISYAQTNINLLANLAASVSDTTILKIPINSNEYFLVENRQRDVNKDGIHINYKIGNQSFSFTKQQDEGRFQWYSADTLKGVVTDVDEFDWAVPGNGILIWHIDESVIANNLSDNKINVDINHRGVSVVEADGIADIGQIFTDIFGDQVEGQATQEDMWYKDNPSKYYQNIFGPYTKPSTISYTGANSLITLSDFSPAGNRMSFKLSFSDSNLVLLAKTQLNLPDLPTLMLTPFNSINDDVYLLVNKNLIKTNKYGSETKTFYNFSDQYPAAIQIAEHEYVIGSIQNKLNVLISDGITENLKSYQLASTVTSPITINEINSNWFVIFGTANGEIVKANIQDLLNDNNVSEGNYTKISTEPIVQVCSSQNSTYYSFLTANTFMDANQTIIKFPEKPKKCVLTKSEAGNYINVVLTEGNNFYIIENGALKKEFNIKSENNISDFSLANLFDDGSNYIVFNNGDKLEAYNLEGSKADFFPFVEPNHANFVATPLTVVFENKTQVFILAFADNGNIYAINPLTGKVLLPFPISSGTKSIVTPILYKHILYPSASILDWTALSLVDKTNTLYTWSIGRYIDSKNWWAEFSNSLNNSFVDAAGVSKKQVEFFPLDRAYNWPNPVFGNTTNIRYYVSEDSDVSIKIFDISGDLVAKLNDKAVGGFDHDTIWDVTNIQSGIYLAHIEVTSVTGKTATKVIKVAIIK
ncbi:T9SS type A sorting domain-containing protein [Melioribacteraceae bacterium 4301-Me]|uniref:T9SS-dependent M6-like inactivated metalloprotease n=1 Tax=Pyranulibacter aquaticus TaxID=3163344 RepID=UPI00359BDFA8